MDIALVITIVLAIIGYIVKYLNDTANYRREKKLALINQRLDMLYGPLYFQVIAGRKIQRMILDRFEMKSPSDPLDEKYHGEWRMFVNEVLMPLNISREKIILENSYLVIERIPPGCLSNFITHVAEYKVVIAKWKDGDYSELFASKYFPTELERYIRRSYITLRKDQRKLIGK